MARQTCPQSHGEKNTYFYQNATFEINDKNTHFENV